MPRGIPKKKRAKKNAGYVDENPYMPTLIRLHDRWEPDQIAQAITAADSMFSRPISRFLVDELSKMPQRELQPASERFDRGPRILPADEENELSMGKCERCHSRPGATVTDIDGVSIVVCGRCYIELNELENKRKAKAKPEPEPEPEAPDAVEE